MTKQIPLANGKGYALVDDEDYEKCMEHHWFNSHGYAATKSRRISCLMHRWLIDAPKGMDVDHINMDKLDNRRENLRVCTRSQNNANQSGDNNPNGYKGVFRKLSKYQAQIRIEGRSVYLGYFTDPAEAARAYDAAAKKYFGEFARLNFPEENT